MQGYFVPNSYPEMSEERERHVLRCEKKRDKKRERRVSKAEIDRLIDENLDWLETQYE